MRDMKIHNPSPQSCDLHFMTLSQVTSLFGSFSMRFLFPSLLKGFPEGHFPQQILQTHIFTSGSAFSGSPDKYQLLAATASIYLLQPWHSCLFCCHSCQQHITPGCVVCLSFLWVRSSPLGRHLTQTNPDSKTR